MNPLRKLFLALSRMPPALMLLIIICLATMITMLVTGRVNERLAEQESRGLATVVVARHSIPAHTKLKSSMLTSKHLKSDNIWKDAFKSKTEAVGKTTYNSIPARAQIRQADIDF